MMKHGALAAAVALLLAGTGAASPRVPAYRPLEHWVKQLDSKDRREQEEAVQRIAALGPQGRAAGPALAARLEGADAGHAVAIAHALLAVGAPEAEAGTRKLLLLRRPRCGNNFVEGGYIERYPGPVVAHLAGILDKDKDENARVLAANFLGQLRYRKVRPSLFAQAGASADRAVEALFAAAKHESPRVRHAAAGALVSLDPRQSKAVLPVVVALIVDGTANPNAAPYLLRHAETDAVPALARLLDADSAEARTRGGSALTSLMPHSRPALTKALLEGPPRARLAAAYALSQASEGLPPAAPALTAALADELKGVRALAALTLARADAKKAGPALPILVTVLREGGPYADWAGTTLVRLGPDARPAVPDLLRALKDENRAARLRAASALAVIDPASAAPAAPTLAEALTGENKNDQLTAAVAAGRIGPAARAAIPGLRAALADTFGTIRLAAADALVKIDRAEAKVAVPALVEMVEDDKFDRGSLPQSAIQALGRMGSAAAAALPVLRKASGEKNGRAPLEAAAAIVRIDPAGSAAAMKVLRSALRGERTGRRMEAFDALEELGPLAREVVPDLTELLRSRSAYEVRRAAEVLGKIGPEARSAAPQLRALLAHRLPFVRKVAATALARVEAAP
jgi:HEAT repeat protein